MNLKKFKITKLFGHINETLEFNTDSSILFIAGKNGSGKTTILKTIDAIARKNWHYLLKVNFQTVNLVFTNGKKINVKKKNSKTGYNLEFTTGTRNNSKVKKQEVSLFDSHNVDELIEELLNNNTIWQLDCGHYADDEDDHMVDSVILKKYGKLKISIPGAINELLNKWNTVYISSDRQISNRPQKGSKKKIRVFEVEMIQDSLQEKLNKIQSKVRENLDKKNVSLVKKLYEKGLDTFEEIDENNFEELMDDFIKKKETLEKCGLSIGNLSNSDEHEKSPEERKLVAFILKETLEAYEPYNELLFSIKLFDSIVNSALSNKKVIIELPDGLNVKIKKGRKIENFSPLILSSGEQQVVILAHSLLFDSPENTMVLIDEPELSMDVDWQTKIYGWLKKISKERNLKILLSTHSPLIVMGKDDSIISLSK